MRKLFALRPHLLLHYLDCVFGAAGSLHGSSPSIGCNDQSTRQEERYRKCRKNGRQTNPGLALMQTIIRSNARFHNPHVMRNRALTVSGNLQSGEVDSTASRTAPDAIAVSGVVQVSEDRLGCEVASAYRPARIAALAALITREQQLSQHVTKSLARCCKRGVHTFSSQAGGNAAKLLDGWSDIKLD